MAFKQPRIPEYRESEGTGKYLKNLVLFLKDFCMESWKATMNLQKSMKKQGEEPKTTDADTVGGMTLEQLDTYFEKLRLEREHPVGGQPYISFLNEEEDNPNVKWPWSTWELDTSGRFLLGASEAYPLGSTGGETAHKLTESELPKISGTIYSGQGNGGADAGGYGAFRELSGKFSGTTIAQYAVDHNDKTNWNGETGYQRATFSFGANGTHNNMPPYMTVNIWKRTV